MNQHTGPYPQPGPHPEPAGQPGPYGPPPGYPPAGHMPPQPPKKRRTGLKVVAGTVGGLVALAVALGSLSGGGERSSAAPTASAGPADSAAPTAEAVAASTPPPVLRAGDIALRVKTLKKSCFGSAGCNVTYTIRVTLPATPPEGARYLVTYRVSGGEEPQINTFTLDGATAEVQQEEFVSTSSPRAVLRARVTEVEQL